MTLLQGLPYKSNQKSDRDSCRNCNVSQKAATRVGKYDVFGGRDCTMYQKFRSELKLFSTFHSFNEFTNVEKCLFQMMKNQFMNL